MSGGSAKQVVAYLGPEASYTHQAALSAFPHESYTLAPQTTIEDVFAAVQSGTATRGVVPFENSSNGSVVFTLDLFADRDAKYSDIDVCGEAYVRVQHCLLVHPNALSSSSSSQSSQIESHPGNSKSSSRDRTPEKTTATANEEPNFSALPRIQKLYSHPQAWGQCTAFLSTHLKGIERQDVSSTSRAAELVAQDPSGTSAAISSFMAARAFGLGVVKRGIEDRKGNCTRFLVLRRREHGEVAGDDDGAGRRGGSCDGDGDGGSVGKRGEENGEGEEEDFKTLVSFTIDHHNPGALAQSLSVFSRYGINLTSINTRPSGVENWNYIFFVELKGRVLSGNKAERGAVNKALRDLDDVCRGWRWLGSWRNRLASVE